MKAKFLPLLALMLCMGALFLPMTAFAEAPNDRTPPTIDAWLTGDALHAEAYDWDSGVEAVYVNGHRFGYLVDGAIEVSPLEDYADKEKYITVHAVDFAGNKSTEVKIENPYYTAPASSPELAQTTPAPTPAPQPAATSSATQSTNNSNTQTSQAAASQQSAPASTPEAESSESAIPSEGNPFTPSGTGSVQDNAMEEDGKEFFTIVTEAENTFYLIIDRQRGNDGVYLLNAVTEDGLMALAEKSDSSVSSESAIPEPEPVPVQPEPEPTPEPEPAPPAGNSTGTIIFIIIAALAAGGAGYYIKILRPKQQAALDGDDEDDLDEDEYGGDPGDEDEYDFSDDYAEFIEDDGVDADREDGGAE